MRFGRKRNQPGGDVETTIDEASAGGLDSGSSRGEGPFDVSEVEVEEGTRADLGSLLITPLEGTDLRVQVDEGSGEVLSVMMLGEAGALEARAFAAPRQAGIWEETRHQIAAEVARLGGTADEREGPFGIELFVQQPVTTEDGQQGVQPSRVMGHEGPRWFLRTTLLGQPAMEPQQAGPWEDAIRAIVVRRGDEAMPPGEALPLVLPANAQRRD